MSYQSYVSAGIQKDRGDSLDRLFGGYEVFLYNPTWKPCDTRMTIYFEAREPYELPDAIHIPPKWSFLQHTANTVPEVLRDAGFWGARYESTVPMIPILIFGTGGFGGEGLDASLTGGVTHFLGTDLHDQWVFPNALWRVTPVAPGTNPLTPPPFAEFEIMYLLNPTERDAEVTLTLQYRNLAHETISLLVPAQRVLTWCNYDQVSPDEPFAVRVVSSEAISASAVRYLHDPQGLTEKGVFVRAGMAGVPGPISE